jgi:hypothetical protein
MIRPASFGFNEETAGSNAFQKNLPQSSSEVSGKAVKEFDGFVKNLRAAGVNVIVIEDTKNPPKPDAVFPNNWFSTHILGNNERLIVTYPMQSHLRRQEVREDVINDLNNEYGYSHIRLEQSSSTEDETFLEGTGSIVFDHDLKRAYAALSPRTDSELLGSLCGRIGYEPIVFSATDKTGRQVYHTNVILTIGKSFAVICTDMIRDENEKVNVIKKLSEGGREIIFIDEKQVNNFAGNMIQLSSKDGKKVLVMSKTAFESLEKDQKEKLQKHNDNIVTANISTIETIGGGSARCMIAEIFHQ